MNTDNKVTANIHETAVIAPGAKIAENVEIGPYSVIGENVEIGEGTKIGPHVVIHGWTQIGKDCRIFQGASIGEEPQDLKFKGEKSYTIICDRTRKSEGARSHRATGAGEEPREVLDCLLMALTHVAHNCVVGNHVIMSNLASLAGHAVVEDRAVIGGMAGVHQFVKIGRNAMVGGMSKLTQDVVPYTIVDGQPAKVVGLSAGGISRAGSPAGCAAQYDDRLPAPVAGGPEPAAGDCRHRAGSRFLRRGRAFPALPAQCRARHLPRAQRARLKALRTEMRE